MTFKGTGLPIQSGERVLTKPTPSIGAVSTAAEWNRIAQVGAQLLDVGADQMARDTNKAQVGYLADQEVEIERTRIDLRNQYANDPAGFDAAWKGYTDGKLGQVEPWAVPHVKKSLGQNGVQGYGAVSNEKRQRDEQLDGQRMKALAESAEKEVMGYALAGRIATPEGQAAVLKHKSVLDSAVNAGLMSREQADLIETDIDSRAGAAVVVKGIGDVYVENRRKGLDAGKIALEAAERDILRNPDLAGLSEAQRTAYYNKAVTEIRSLESERKTELAAAKQAARQVETMLGSGVRVPLDQVDEIAKELEAAGGHADAAKLRASSARYDQLQSFSKQPLQTQVDTLDNLRTSAGVPRVSGEVNAFINERWAQSGVPLPVGFIRMLFRRESGGNPNAVTGSYNGLGMLSRQQFAKYGRPGGNIYDPKDNAEATIRKVQDLYQQFRRDFQRDPTPTELYMYHQQGTGGGANHIRNPNAPAWVNMWATGEGRSKGQAWSKRAIWGNIPDDMKKLFPGGVETVTSADFMAVWAKKFGDTNNVPDLKLVSGAQRIVGAEAKETWTKINTQLDAGQRPEPSQIELVSRAAALAGDHELLETMGERLARFEQAQMAGRAPLAAQQGAAAELAAQPGLTAGQAAFQRELEKVQKDTAEKLENDPVSLVAERFPERYRVPGPLDLSNRDEAIGGMWQRAQMARFASEHYGKSGIPMITQSDGTVLANAITGTDNRQTTVALDALSQVPDEFFTATIARPEIRAAIQGAARSTDPEKYAATMMALDKMWGRNPAEVDRLLGEDVVRSLQDWQGRLRYASVKDLTERLVRRDDPQVIEQRKSLVRSGATLAAKRTFDDLLDAMDPGVFEAQPGAPVDPGVRITAMADYQRLFAERYAETQDAKVAHEQAIDRMKLAWGKSETNDGRLTLRPPENYYPAVNGSHSWMKTQLAEEVANAVGRLPDKIEVVADRQTEADIAAGRPVSYLVAYAEKDQPPEIVRTEGGQVRRFTFNPSQFQTDARAEFQRQRDRWKGSWSVRGVFQTIDNSPMFEGFGIKTPTLKEAATAVEESVRTQRQNNPDPVQRFVGEARRRLREGGSLVNRGE